MVNFIIFLVFACLLLELIFGALGTYFSGQKGISPLKGFLIGIFFNLFGLIWIAFMKNTSENIVEQMYERKLMNLKEFNETMQLKIDKKKKNK